MSGNAPVDPVGIPVFTGDLALLDTKVTDLSPLKDMPLTNLTCDFKPDRDAAVLRSISTLQTLNDKPAREVLK